MRTWILILEIIGTVAFSVSGALMGIQKKMDLFGVSILGVIAAVGGGVLRDLILGITPPIMFKNPIYALIAVTTSIIVFIPAVRGRLMLKHKIYDTVMLIMDSIGLGVFTVVGIETACSSGNECGFFLLIFVGVITGVGGGVLRDMLSGNMPYIFVKHVYACASLVGAILCALLWEYLPRVWVMLFCAMLIVLLRLLSAHFKWNLPRA